MARRHQKPESAKNVLATLRAFADFDRVGLIKEYDHG